MKMPGWMLTCALVAFAGNVRSAAAIPPFQKAFHAKYVDSNDNADFVKAATEAKCALCHIGRNKSAPNPYCEELSKLLDTKNDFKNLSKINAALDEVAQLKSFDGMRTYGERIAAGLLPGG